VKLKVAVLVIDNEIEKFKVEYYRKRDTTLKVVCMTVVPIAPASSDPRTQHSQKMQQFHHEIWTASELDCLDDMTIFTSPDLINLIPRVAPRVP